MSTEMKYYLVQYFIRNPGQPRVIRTNLVWAANLYSAIKGLERATANIWTDEFEDLTMRQEGEQ